MDIDIEGIVNKEIVREVFDKLDPDIKTKVLEESLTRALTDVFSKWNVERAVKEDAERYMLEYVKQPHVQERIKNSVQISMDNVLCNMTDAFERQIDKTIKNEYNSFASKGGSR